MRESPARLFRRLPAFGRRHYSCLQMEISARWMAAVGIFFTLLPLGAANALTQAAGFETVTGDSDAGEVLPAQDAVTSTTPDAGTILFGQDQVVAPEPPPRIDHVPAEVASETTDVQQMLDSGGQIDIEQLDIEALLDLPVVTASGVAELRSEAAANVIAFTRSDIERMGWRSVADVLRHVPGMYVVDDLVLPSVGVRGISGGLRGGSRIIKVMINGRSVNFRPELTAFLGPEYIPMEAVERIEVAKGPLSALYGANAFVAVVNVITRRQHTGSVASLRGVLVRDRPGYGISAMAANSGTNHDVLLAVSQDHVDRSGLSVSRTFESQDPTLSRYRPFFAQPTRGDISAPLSVFGYLRGSSQTVGDLVVQGGIQRLDAVGEFQVNSVLTHQSRHALINAWANVDHERRWSEALVSRLSLGVSRGHRAREDQQYLTTSRDSYFTRNYGYGAVDAAGSLEFSPLEWVTITGGVDYSYEPQRILYYTEHFNAPRGDFRSGDSNKLLSEETAPTVTLSNLGAFVQASSSPIRALPDLKLTGNFRLDFPSVFPTQYSWRAAAIYRWNPEVVTKIIAGRAFQSPSATLLYAQPGFGISGNVVGSETVKTGKQLTPQTIQSVELVTTAELFQAVALEAAVFAQQIDDRIEFVQSGANFRATNQGEQRNIGVELAARGAIGRFAPFISASAQGIIDGEESSGLTPLYPNLMGRAGTFLEVPEASLTVMAQARVVGPRASSQSNTLLNNAKPYELPGYVEVDARVGTSNLYLLGDKLSTQISVTGTNLLNARYSDPGFGGLDIPALGRTVMLELRQSM